MVDHALHHLATVEHVELALADAVQVLVGGFESYCVLLMSRPADPDDNASAIYTGLWAGVVSGY